MADGITLEQAQQVVDAARRKASDEGLNMNIAIVDAGDNLTAFARMDGAWLGSIGIALDKAHSARAFDMPTQQLATMSQPGQPLFGIHTLNQGRIVIFAGGIPLHRGEQIVGAIGVSGGTPDQDHMVAEAGVAAL